MSRLFHSFAGMLCVALVRFSFSINWFFTLRLLSFDINVLFVLFYDVVNYMYKIIQILAWVNFLKMQVIAMTEELLSTAKHNQNFGSDIGTSGSASPSFPQSQKNENVNCHPYMILLF